VLALVDPLAPPIELRLEVEWVGEAAAGLEIAVQEAVVALERALGLAIARLEDDQPSASWPQKPANSAVGRPPPAWTAPSRSQTSFFGRAPSRARQRLMPQAMSANSLVKMSAPQKLRE
jgi:hypothetical protein